MKKAIDFLIMFCLFAVTFALMIGALAGIITGFMWLGGGPIPLVVFLFILLCAVSAWKVVTETN